MKAELLMHEVYRLDEQAAVEIVIWRLPKPQAGSQHGFKYRLAYVERGRCVLRYDNEAGASGLTISATPTACWPISGTTWMIEAQA